MRENEKEELRQAVNGLGRSIIIGIIVFALVFTGIFLLKRAFKEPTPAEKIKDGASKVLDGLADGLDSLFKK